MDGNVQIKQQIIHISARKQDNSTNTTQFAANFSKYRLEFEDHCSCTPFGLVYTHVVKSVWQPVSLRFSVDIANKNLLQKNYNGLKQEVAV